MLDGKCTLQIISRPSIKRYKRNKIQYCLYLYLRWLGSLYRTLYINTCRGVQLRQDRVGTYLHIIFIRKICINEMFIFSLFLTFYQKSEIKQLFSQTYLLNAIQALVKRVINYIVVLKTYSVSTMGDVRLSNLSLLHVQRHMSLTLRQ